MIRHSHWRSAVFCFATCALVATAAQSQDKVHLQFSHAVGTVADTEFVTEMNLSIKPTADGQPLPPQNSSNRAREKYQETEISLGDDGKPNAIKRVYEAKHEMDTEADKPPKLVTSPLEGKTVTVQREGDKVTVGGDAGAIGDKERADLQDALDSSFDLTYPDHDLTVGDTWTVDSAALAHAFGKADKATLTGKLLEVVPFGGHQCAHIQLNLELQTPLEGTQDKMTMKLSGDLYHALDIQRPLAMSISGPLNMKSQSKQDGHDIALVGTGTMQMKVTSTWTVPQ